MNGSLFADIDSPVVNLADMPDAEVSLYPSLLPSQQADELLASLQENINWKQEQIKMYGKTFDIPRMTAWYGDPNIAYTYSGIKVESNKWIPELLEIKKTIEKISEVQFNCVLLNLYRSGNDGVSWHSDDEPELGDNPVIGSMSLGQERVFQMKHKKSGERKDILLNHGSYLLMKGATQSHWQHQIPKSKKVMGKRINLTFRNIRE